MPHPSPKMMRDWQGFLFDFALVVWQGEWQYPCLAVRELRCECGHVYYLTEAAEDMYDMPCYSLLCYSCTNCGTYYGEVADVPKADQLRFGHIPDLTIEEYRVRYMPGAAPEFVEGTGDYQAQVQVRKACKQGTVEHKLFGGWKTWDSLKAEDESKLEAQINRVLNWLKHYHTYYNMPSWEVRVGRKQPGQGVVYAET